MKFSFWLTNKVAIIAIAIATVDNRLTNTDWEWRLGLVTDNLQSFTSG